MKHCEFGLECGMNIKLGKDILRILRIEYPKLFETDLGGDRLPYITANAEYIKDRRVWKIRGLAVDNFNLEMTGLNNGDNPDVAKSALEEALENRTGPSFSEGVKLKTLNVTCNGNFDYSACESSCPWYVG